MARQSKAEAAAAAEALWTRRAAWMLVALLILRLLVNRLDLIPVHFDEAQYWVYGEEMALGYYSKPPLVAWLIRAATDAFGMTLFALRLFAPVAHLLIGWLIFLAGRRLWDARTGFWSAALYSAAPGVTVSSMLMTTDPPMMAGWALALWSLVRAIEAEPAKKGRRKPAPAPFRPGWWALAGLGVGLGMMAKYTAIAFPLSALGYALFSREGERDRRGALILVGAALLVLSPNLIWNAQNGFATVAHLGENAEIQGRLAHPGKLAEFLGAQLGVIGPAAFLAILAALPAVAFDATLRGDWRMRLLAWLTAPLLIAMCVQAFLSEANPNWAAPAYVAGSILAARWLLSRSWIRALQAQLAIGAAAFVALLGLATAYSFNAQDLPRAYDPFKKMRLGGPFCERALAALEGEEADALLSNDRRRLSECMFEGGLRLGDIAIYDPDGTPNNHYEMASRLELGDRRRMVLAVQNPILGEEIAARFETAELMDEGSFATHSDNASGYAIWVVEGFRGY